jgi:hypothetical protein
MEVEMRTLMPQVYIFSVTRLLSDFVEYTNVDGRPVVAPNKPNVG